MSDALPPLSRMEQAAASTITTWVKESRSSRAATPLSALVFDEKSWRPPRIRFRNRGGTRAWFQCCQLRGWADRLDQLADLKELLAFIEGSGADSPSVRAGLALVHSFVRATIIGPRLNRAAEAQMQATIEAKREKNAAYRRRKAANVGQDTAGRSRAAPPKVAGGRSVTLNPDDRRPKICHVRRVD